MCGSWSSSWDTLRFLFRLEIRFEQAGRRAARSIEVDRGGLNARLELGGRSAQEETVAAQGTES